MSSKLQRGCPLRLPFCAEQQVLVHRQVGEDVAVLGT
jgi:hypothetical protein